MKTGDPIIIRVSSLTGWGDCPRRGAARLFWRVIRDAGFVLRSTNRGIGAAVGTAVHRAAALCFDQKARTGELPSEGRAIDCAVYELADQIGHQPIEYDGPRGATHNRNTAEQQTARMTRGYWRTVAPTVDPIMVEERLEAEIAPGLVLSGQPDIVAREPNAIRDLKTSARSIGNHSGQIGGYSLLARSHGFQIDEGIIDGIMRVPLSKPQPDPVSVRIAVARAEQTATTTIHSIAESLRIFREGDERRRLLPGDPAAFMANPMSTLCNPKYCPAHSCGPNGFCREYKGADDE